MASRISRPALTAAAGTAATTTAISGGTAPDRPASRAATAPAATAAKMPAMTAPVPIQDARAGMATAMSSGEGVGVRGSGRDLAYGATAPTNSQRWIPRWGYGPGS